MVSLPAVILLGLWSQPAPLSPGARCILDVTELYDIEIDRPANHLLVSCKAGGNGFVLSLDKLEPLGTFEIPSAELEDMELDPEAREIYHVDRDSGKLLVVDADTFHVRRAGVVAPLSSHGSTKLALDRRSSRLLVSWEDNDLFVVDRASLEWSLVSKPGNVNLLADRRNGLVYVNSESQGSLAALDLGRMRQVAAARAPARGERMALSEKRQELYLPDAEGGTVWVYSTPDLRLLRKIPVEFGVRPIAVDDQRGWLLTASVVSGYVEITDLQTGRKLARHYVGKYGRILRVDPATRRAFLTLTKDGLFLLNY
jgi:hypothetical protein